MHIILIDNEAITNPHVNLALEEYIPQIFNQLLFYINKKSILVGWKQNTL